MLPPVFPSSFPPTPSTRPGPRVSTSGETHQGAEVPSGEEWGVVMESESLSKTGYSLTKQFPEDMLENQLPGKRASAQHAL